jgi:hypothetical protein
MIFGTKGHTCGDVLTGFNLTFTFPWSDGGGVLVLKESEGKRVLLWNQV